VYNAFYQSRGRRRLPQQSKEKGTVSDSKQKGDAKEKTNLPKQENEIEVKLRNLKTYFDGNTEVQDVNVKTFYNLDKLLNRIAEKLESKKSLEDILKPKKMNETSLTTKHAERGVCSTENCTIS